jgi:hypothetical protein
VPPFVHARKEKKERKTNERRIGVEEEESRGMNEAREVRERGLSGIVRMA